MVLQKGMLKWTEVVYVADKEVVFYSTPSPLKNAAFMAEQQIVLPVGLQFILTMCRPSWPFNNQYTTGLNPFYLRSSVLESQALVYFLLLFPLRPI